MDLPRSKTNVGGGLDTDARLLLDKRCKINHLGIVAEKTDGEFRDQRILRINNFEARIDVDGNHLFRHE